MGRMKKRSPVERHALRLQLFEDIEAGRLTIAEAVLRMRQVTGLTQKDFADRVAGVSLPTLQRIEQGEERVQLDTLRRVGRHFGLDVGFVRKPPAQES